MIKSWMCQSPALISGYGIVRPGTVLEFEDGKEPAYVKANFKCMTASQVKEEKERKLDDNDLTFQAKMEKLKDMKVKIPAGAKRKDIEKLFDEEISKVTLPNIV